MPSPEYLFTQNPLNVCEGITQAEVILSFSQCVTYYVDQAGSLWKSMEFDGRTRYALLSQFSPSGIPIWVTCGRWINYLGIPQEADLRELSYYEYTQIHPAVFLRHDPDSVDSALAWPFP